MEMHGDDIVLDFAMPALDCPVPVPRARICDCVRVGFSSSRRELVDRLTVYLVVFLRMYFYLYSRVSVVYVTVLYPNLKFYFKSSGQPNS